MILRVITPFNGYQVGDEITDEKAVADILASEQAANVVKVAAPAAKSK
ncbi:hypothetical protein [Cupriavidus taiwanensis]|nr:hypothetical protein [Cupriavidus taiwanensis]SOY56853.1 conserved hypothetical protein [Cupriavidus taiwanensis]SOY90790.1 conserved hypothetical protein [Cupriavidus taiwanensis]SOZ63562.1 conserved hypothetical protein [Cupriavidus taiwanensis]SOZ82602.1 conserved hypothetical protein [Cupriavidus taiwanensis]SOZ84446.1 conserved hypothetical protein [Cupriavidus taiwanensis]